MVNNQEVLFSWTQPNETNRLSFFSRFAELKLFTYINEFELMFGTIIEKSVNIDYIITNIIITSKKTIKRFIKLSSIIWGIIKSRELSYSNSC